MSCLDECLLMSSQRVEAHLPSGLRRKLCEQIGVARSGDIREVEAQNQG